MQDESLGISSNLTTVSSTIQNNTNFINCGVRVKIKKCVSFKNIKLTKNNNNLSNLNNQNKLYYRSSTSDNKLNESVKSILKIKKLKSFKSDSTSVSASHVSKGIMSKKSMKLSKKITFKEGDKLAEIKKVESISHFYLKPLNNKKGKDDKTKGDCSCACIIY